MLTAKAKFGRAELRGSVLLVFPQAAAHRFAAPVTARAAEPAGGLKELTSAAGSLKHP